MKQTFKISKKVAFPIFGHYNLCIKYFVENALDAEYIMQPPMTRRTIEMGEHLSPDSVCTPFKSTLGSMIEALESGADTLIMTLGLCRLGYYAELQQLILHEQGYDFDFINLSEYATGKKSDYLKAIRRINPKASPSKLAIKAAETLRMMKYLDEIQSEYYKNCGFELNKGSYKKVYKEFLVSMEIARNIKDIELSYRTAKRKLLAVPLKDKHNVLKVGVIGEYFTAMDAFSNLNVEQKLADYGIEVHRWLNVTNRNLKYNAKNLAAGIAEYCEYDMGPTSTANIWCAKNYASKGFDGIVHVKSAGCTPEIDIMPVLQNIGRDYNIPVLYLTYDAQTSDTGLDTRLEAFYDMISMRKKVK